MRWLYSLAAYLLVPWALLHLLLRARRQPAYLRHLRERFGFYPAPAADPTIWIHAVSVGETRAAEPLVQALRARHASRRIVLTHMTPTGRETARSLFGDTVEIRYLPYDLPGAVRRFLKCYRPALGIVMETELWPNLIHGCAAGAIPVYLVNARLSERSAARYRGLRGLTAPMLRALAGIGAQTARDAERLHALGASRVVVTGNLKFDRTAPPAQLELGNRLRERFGRARPVFLAASTREGEEALLIEPIRRLSDAGALVVLVPRHPQRFDEVAQLLKARGLPFQRRSDDTAIQADTRVVLGDSMGEMYAYYAACDVAFVGGSLLPFGGQNLLEACAVGKPVLVGPHTFNFEEATEQAIAEGAALRVPNPDELVRAASVLLAEPERARAMGEAGRRFTATHRGATERTLTLLGL
ncbi:MAG TPA: lipid IV(A) 3-deoxy-D-manno-octulosonic acid transferase [Burkholderiales bacterium]|jgi:3-deoxy-D-manno-octulosonic-acid transferase|nr:lipid IV(A) 3-deoxy-D-manno-octulosonic acid transferase [Burkholderiales bacterium]